MALTGWRNLGQALRLGALLGVIFGVFNILHTWWFPLADDTIGALLRFYGPMFGAWAFAAFRAARHDGRVSSGIVTGIAIAFATFAVFGLMNLLRVNLFLGEVTGRADWQRMTAIFRASQIDSLRAFIVMEYVKDMPLKVAVASTIGAVMGLAGGSLGCVLRERRES